MVKIYVYADPMSRRRTKRLKTQFSPFHFFSKTCPAETYAGFFFTSYFRHWRRADKPDIHRGLKYLDAQTRENQNPRQGSHQPTTRMHRAQGGTRGQIASRGKTEGSTRSCSHFLFSWRTNKVISARWIATNSEIWANLSLWRWLRRIISFRNLCESAWQRAGQNYNCLAWKLLGFKIWIWTNYWCFFCDFSFSKTFVSARGANLTLHYLK